MTIQTQVLPGLLDISVFKNQPFQPAGAFTGAGPCHEIEINNLSMRGEELINSLALKQTGSAKAAIDVYCGNCSEEIKRSDSRVFYADSMDVAFCSNSCKNDFFGL